MMRHAIDGGRQAARPIEARKVLRCKRNAKNTSSLVFLHKISMSGKINGLENLQGTGMHWNEELVSELG